MCVCCACAEATRGMGVGVVWAGGRGGGVVGVWVRGRGWGCVEKLVGVGEGTWCRCNASSTQVAQLCGQDGKAECANACMVEPTSAFVRCKSNQLDFRDLHRTLSLSCEVGASTAQVPP